MNSLKPAARGVPNSGSDDQTKLALGPRAKLKLDDFVIGKSDGVTTIALNFLKGTFRFITGSKKAEILSN